ncbi:MAG: FAD-binding oxidoreductase [Acidimicrobiaceae bacterium]|nr:FAD-binding oxidoreductase [Acidimicrobiaceae bacterium]
MSGTVVVGGGLVGTALAYELSLLGIEVTLVDRHDPGRATDAGAGICSPETIMGRDEAWMEVAFAARDHYDQLASSLSATQEADIGFSLTGLLSTVTGAHEEPWLDDVLARAEARCPGGLVEIEPEEAQGRFPPLAPPRRAILNQHAARIDGVAVTTALREAAARRGVEILPASVTQLRLQGRRVVAVETTEGRRPCEAAVIAGGAWSAAFDAALGVHLPVRPLKGQIAHLVLESAAESSGHWPIVQPLFGFYLVPWPGGRVACGGTMEAVGFDHRVTAAGAADLLREALKTAPGLGDATLSEIRVGLRPVSDDDRPIVGRLAAFENVFVDTGHGTDGLLLGPYCGHLLAAEIAGTAQAALTTFAPDRF